MADIIGIGTDITECLRIARMIERHGDLFLSRVYTSREIQYCTNRKQTTEHFTGRWAAKEAVLKAIGTGWRRGISWRDMEILNDRSGKPTLSILGGVREVAEELRIAKLLVTISHCRTHATSTVIAVGPDK